MDAGLSCYVQPFGYSGMPWAWDLYNIAAQVNFTHQMAQHWDKAYPGRVYTVHYEELVMYPRCGPEEVWEVWERGGNVWRHGDACGKGVHGAIRGAGHVPQMWT